MTRTQLREEIKDWLEDRFYGWKIYDADAEDIMMKVDAYVEGVIGKDENQSMDAPLSPDDYIVYGRNEVRAEQRARVGLNEKD